MAGPHVLWLLQELKSNWKLQFNANQQPHWYMWPPGNSRIGNEFFANSYEKARLILIHVDQQLCPCLKHLHFPRSFGAIFSGIREKHSKLRLRHNVHVPTPECIHNFLSFTNPIFQGQRLVVAINATIMIRWHGNVVGQVWQHHSDELGLGRAATRITRTLFSTHQQQVEKSKKGFYNCTPENLWQTAHASILPPQRTESWNEPECIQLNDDIIEATHASFMSCLMIGTHHEFHVMTETTQSNIADNVHVRLGQLNHSRNLRIHASMMDAPNKSV